MLKAILKKLLKPLNYLRIKQRQKTCIDIHLPAFVAALLLGFIYWSPVPIKILGSDGLVTLINGLLQMLVGFFVASLAAVATFNRDGMDEIMVGKAPTLNGVSVTRRQFVCYMFGYLAFMSIIAYFSGGIVNLGIDAIRVIAGTQFATFRVIGLYLYLVVICNIVFTTLLSLYFLTDRVVRDDDEKPVPKEF
ncbi:hypothetical protein ACSWYU_000266 [Vibrio harveyi]